MGDLPYDRVGSNVEGPNFTRVVEPTCEDSVISASQPAARYPKRNVQERGSSRATQRKVLLYLAGLVGSQRMKERGNAGVVIEMKGNALTDRLEIHSTRGGRAKMPDPSRLMAWLLARPLNYLKNTVINHSSWLLVL